MKKRRILIIYEKNHVKHPFIKLLIKSLLTSPDVERVTVTSFASVAEVGQDGSEFIPLKPWLLRQKRLQDIHLRAYGSRLVSFRLIKTAFEIFSANRPDIVVCFLPVCFLASALASIRFKFRVVYYPFEIYGHQRSKFSRAVVLAERLGFVIGPAAFVTQNEQRARFYAVSRNCRNRAFIAHNYKEKPRDLAKDPSLFNRFGVPLGAKVVLYQGMLSEGRWLDRLIHSSLYFDAGAVLVMMGPKQQPWWDSEIAPLLRDVRFQGRVFILDSVPHESVRLFASAASVGVIIYDDSVLNNLYCEPGKIGDFIHSGVSVVAPGFPSIKPVVEGYGLGVVFEDYSPQGIASAINKVLAQPIGEFSKSLAAASKFMTWDAQWPSLLSIITGGRQ